MKSIFFASILALASVASAGVVAREQAAVDPRYACTSASDCAIVEHGNCCGARPVCAQPDATFTPEEVCSGDSSVCGFPVIESCDCIEGACHGMQDGNSVSPPLE